MKKPIRMLNQQLETLIVAMQKGELILALFLFVFIAWVTIVVFSIFPKGLNTIENIIMYFCISIMIISFCTIACLNLKLIESSQKLDMYISLLTNRDIIIPLTILTFINSISYFKEKPKKIAAAVTTLSILIFDEFLTTRLSLKFYRGWNIYFAIISMSVVMVLSIFLMNGLKKIK